MQLFLPFHFPQDAAPSADALHKHGSACWEEGPHSSMEGSLLFMHRQARGHGSTEKLHPWCFCTSGSSPGLRIGPCCQQHGSGVLQCREDADSHVEGCNSLLLCLLLLQGTFCTSTYPATNSGVTTRKVNPAELTPISEISQELKSPHFLRKPG